MEAGRENPPSEAMTELSAVPTVAKGSTPSAGTAVEDDRPAVLIIGGLGYIGRFLALYLDKNNLASEVRLVDKVLPQLAWLAPEFVEACSQDKFIQADASREPPYRGRLGLFKNLTDRALSLVKESFPKIFNRSNGKEFTYVFNCGGETRYSQPDSVYAARSLSLTQALARECSRRRISAFVEFSTGMVYKPPSSSTISAGGCTEAAPIKPWLKFAKYKLLAEEACAQETGLNYVILRLAHVYGEYDVGFLARGLCLARVYQSKGEEMKWLYGKDLRIHTVHVLDVCTAAWLAAQWCATHPRSAVSDPSTVSSQAHSTVSPILVPTSPITERTPDSSSTSRIFNIVDSGDTTQGTLATIIASIFAPLATGFHSSLINTFARFNLESVVDDVNEDILQPWADLLAANGITRPGPISPFMEKELLRDADLALRSTRARDVLGWKENVGRDRLTEENVKTVVESYRRQGWFP